MSWIVYRGFEDSLGRQRCIKSTEVVLTPTEPRWQRIEDPSDGTPYRALVSTLGLQERGKNEVCICEASAVLECQSLEEAKHRLARNLRERPILCFSGGQETPQELAHLPDLKADVVSRMPQAGPR